MSSARSWVVLLLTVTASTPAVAQDQDGFQISDTSRAALLAAEREKKETETTAPRRSRIERALYGYDNGAGTPFIFQPWHGFQLSGGGFPAGAGTTFGVAFTHDLGPTHPAADPNRANRMEVQTVAAYSTRGYSRGSAGFNVYHLGGAPLDVRARAQHYEFPQEDFFGLGQNSLEQNRTNYLLRSTEASAELQWKPARLFEIGGGVSYLTPTIGVGTDSRYPSTEQLFNPSTIPGYEKQPDFLRSDASVAFDWRDNPLHPHAGGRYGVALSDYRDQNFDSFDFRRISVDLQQHVPIPNRYRTIALHAAAVVTDRARGSRSRSTSSRRSAARSCAASASSASRTPTACS